MATKAIGRFPLTSSAIAAAVLALLGFVAAHILGASSTIVVGVGFGSTIGALVFSIAVFAWSLGETLVARENQWRIFTALREVAGDRYVNASLTDEERQAVATARSNGESGAALDVRGSFTRPGQGKHGRLVVLADGDVWWVTHAGGPGTAGAPPNARRTKP